MIYPYNLSFSLSLLLMGFLLANIFGILTNSKNVIFLFVLFIEIINYLAYSKRNIYKQSYHMDNITFLYDRFSAIQPIKSRLPLKSIFYNKELEKNKKRIVFLIISIIISSLNFLKVGFEFGFFIDAFKLGS